MNDETTTASATINETIEEIETNFFTLSKQLKKLVSGIDFDLTKSSFNDDEQKKLNAIAELKKQVELAKLETRNDLFQTCNINASLTNDDFTTETFRGKTMYIYNSEICLKLGKTEEELYNVNPEQVQNLLYSETSLFVDCLKQVCKLFNINDYTFNIEFLNSNKFIVAEQKHDIIQRKASTTNNTNSNNKTFELKRLSVASNVTESTKIGNYIVTCQYFADYNKFVVIDEQNGNKELTLKHTDQPNELVKQLGLICFGKETERNGKKYLSDKFPLHFSYIAKP